MSPQVTVIGIGADGWEGLPPSSRVLVENADVVLGGHRHLDMLPNLEVVKEPWPSPLLEGLPLLLSRYDGRHLVVLASGDPLVSGIATNLIALLGADAVHVVPGISSVALARARMGWSAESADVVTLVGRDYDAVRRYLSPGRRLIVLTSDGTSPAEVAARLVEAGFGSSSMVVLSDLGAATESRMERRARDWGMYVAPELNIVCVECRSDGSKPSILPAFTTVPGLPDAAFEHDGQITKRDLRVSALSRLAPCPGELLWDLGAGAGSIAIEWLRSDPRCRAAAVERDAERVEMIRRNAKHLGVPALQVVYGQVPEALASLDKPDAIFIGGGASSPGLIDMCWAALSPGGRLVVHAVTLETEQAVVQAAKRLGGELTRISVETVSPLGGFTSWTPLRAVVQWTVSRPYEPES